MKLADIKRGTKLSLFKESGQRAVGDAISAELKYIDQDYSFVVYSVSLFENFDAPEFGPRFIVAFEVGPMVYSFTVALKEKMRAENMVLLELVSEIESYNRRDYVRDEMLFRVDIYHLPEDKLTADNLRSLANEPIMSDTTFDISSGGMCIITNSPLKPGFGPYFLVELVISERDDFLLPAKLVRSSTHRRSTIGKYDYGFAFLLDHMPGVKSRLTSAIMTKKLASP